MHTDNNKKDMLILGKDPVQGLGDTILNAEKEYSINFTKREKKIVVVFIDMEATVIYLSME